MPHASMRMLHACVHAAEVWQARRRPTCGGGRQQALVLVARRIINKRSGARVSDVA
jgi:hypothetical protein